MQPKTRANFTTSMSRSRVLAAKSRISLQQKHLIFQQTIVTNEKMIFDTNYNSVEQIRINGMTVFLYRYTDETFWAYGEYGNSIYVLAGDTIQKEEIEKIYKHWIW